MCLLVAMRLVPRRRAVYAALVLCVAATCVASVSSHPLDKFHEDFPRTTIVKGPGSVAKEQEINADSISRPASATDVVATAVRSWHTANPPKPRLADVAPSNEESEGSREEDGGNADAAFYAKRRDGKADGDDGSDAEEVHGSAVESDGSEDTAKDSTGDATQTTTDTTENNSSPFCAPCVGCSVDWVAASEAARPGGSDCRGHGPCGSCFVDLAAINGTYALPQFGDGHDVKRETGASAATVLRAMNIFSETLKAKALAETGSSRVDDTSTAGAETGKPAAASKAPFVKFVCVPGLPRHKTVCEPGVPVPSELRLVTNTKSLQRLSDFCGLEQISTRSWIANVVGTAPAGLPLDPWTTHPTTVPVNQTGIFSSPANGVALSALCGRPTSAAELLPKTRSHDVVRAALFDFLFCAGDRHTQNVYVSTTAELTLIDNDNLLGEQVYTPSGGADDRRCAISSLFLPGTMESWRLRRSKFCANQLGTLDYRCHVGPSGLVALPPRLTTCLAHFAKNDPQATQNEFGLLELVYAETLRQRSGDLLEHGFMEAIKKAGAVEKRISDAASGERPTGKKWEELNEDEKSKMMAWRDSMWRPTEPAVCHGLAPNWKNAPFDYRADETFVGGEESVDETGAQIETS